MKKKVNLKQRAELAEKRSEDRFRRMRNMDRELRRANAISDGSQIMVSVLAGMIGREFHVPAEAVEAGKRTRYMVRQNEDGSLDFCLREILDGRAEAAVENGVDKVENGADR